MMGGPLSVTEEKKKKDCFSGILGAGLHITFHTFLKLIRLMMTIKHFLRFVEKLKNPVVDVLEVLLNDENSRLSQLKPFWRAEGGNLEEILMEELEKHWKGLAMQGMKLGEAAR